MIISAKQSGVVGKADLLPRYARRIDGEVLASARANAK
jgi:hypothetical protein